MISQGKVAVTLTWASGTLRLGLLRRGPGPRSLRAGSANLAACCIGTKTTPSILTEMI